ncbi:MAG: response regulator, partial [Calditrichaeota bacterium]|nr:response regulator [Calditrichota bacterium]
NPARLLIIEDEASLRQVVHDYFCTAGYEVTTAADGREGLAKFSAASDIDLVLSDIRLPVMDGLEVLERIKKKDPSIQVILMTGYSEKDLAIQALRLGADDYVEKPFQLDDLEHIVQRALGRRRVQSFSARWLSFLEKLPLGFAWCDERGIIQGITRDTEDLLCAPEKELLGRPIFEVAGCQALLPWFADASSSPGLRAARAELEIGERWLSVYRTHFSPPKSPRQILLCFSDATEHKSLERELVRITREIEEHVEERTQSLKVALEFSDRLLDAAGVLIAYFPADGKPPRWNKFAQKLCGYTERELREADPCALLSVDGDKGLEKLFHPIKACELSDYLADIRTRNGEIRTLNWQTAPLRRRKSVVGRLVIGMDMTAQKKLEAQLQKYTTQLEEMVEERTAELLKKDVQLIHSARLASLGEMAAGIIHEMKQPLNGISITADLIRLQHKRGELSDETLYNNLEMIRSMVGRLAKIINHLRGFCHIDSSKFSRINLRTAIDGTFAILGEQLRLHQTEVIREIAEDLPDIWGELNQIEQVLVNLIQNARDAMDELGRKYQSQEETAPPGWKKVLTVRAGTTPDKKRVFVEVSDTGGGMPPEVRARLFEPFFTTKETGQGTGLGLSISANIIQSHQGEIQVETQEGVGSTFRVLLPIAP